MTAPNPANRLYRGRTLTGYDQEGEHIAGWAEVSYESMRAINHLTLGGAIPAPIVYEALGHIMGVGLLLPQALTQLGQSLADSLAVYDVYDNDGNPAENVAKARSYLYEAADAATQLGRMLEAGRDAIAAQGFRGGVDDDR
ncbi:MAG: hypothetical protein WAW88_13515 [Nocardioides sp.]